MADKIDIYILCEIVQYLIIKIVNILYQWPNLGIGKTMSYAETSLMQVPIQFNSSYCGVALKEIELPDCCLCLGLVRKKEVILASEEPIVHCWDIILAVAIEKRVAPALEVILKKRHPVLWSSLRSPFPAREKTLNRQDFLKELCCKD